MTAMITESRRVTIRGTMAEGATIALWLAENCPIAARNVGSNRGDRLYETMIVKFEDETEYAKFKLFHSEEFNEPARRQAQREEEANRLSQWTRRVLANPPQGMTLVSEAFCRTEEDDD